MVLNILWVDMSEFLKETSNTKQAVIQNIYNRPNLALLEKIFWSNTYLNFVTISLHLLIYVSSL